MEAANVEILKQSSPHLGAQPGMRRRSGNGLKQSLRRGED